MNWARDAEVRFAVGAALLALLPTLAPAWQLIGVHATCYMLLAASLAGSGATAGCCAGAGGRSSASAPARQRVTLGMLPFAPTLVSSMGRIAGGVRSGAVHWLLGMLFSPRAVGRPFFGIVTLAIAFIVELSRSTGTPRQAERLMNVPTAARRPGGEERRRAALYYAMLGVLAAVVLLIPWRAVGRVLLAIRNHEPRARRIGGQRRARKDARLASAAVAAWPGAVRDPVQFRFAC
jgi:ABC-type branched-subunit amino acid transport system permease subunit